MKDNIETNSASFRIQLSSNWFRENDIISEDLVVLEKPKRKWYKVFFQFLTIGFYQAPWEYKVKRKK